MCRPHLMITIFVERDGKTEQAAKFDRGWLNPASGVHVWVDLAAPSIPEGLILTATFAFHPLSVEEVTLDPPGDVHAPADYRRRLAEVVVARAIVQANERGGS